MNSLQKIIKTISFIKKQKSKITYKENYNCISYHFIVKLKGTPLCAGPEFKKFKKNLNFYKF
jgi:hypothetical protein